MTEFGPNSPELHKLLLLDSLATRYHLLPSEIMTRSDTLDILVMDAAVSWSKYMEDQQQAKRDGRPPAPQIPVNKLQDMMRAAKNEIQT